MHSSSTIIASSGVFQIEFLEKVHNEDFGDLINVSKALEKEFGLRAILTESTIEKYFNHSKSLPFIARYRGEIIGYIIGIPLEELSQEPWVITEKNFGKKNTIYTYAFVIMDLYRKNGYAKMLKKVLILLIYLISFSNIAFSQIDVTCDIYSRYVWRGTDFGNSASIQPGLSYTTGPLTIGAWSACQHSGIGSENDLYATYSVGDFSLTITDYYFPGTDFNSTAKDTGAHNIEISLGASISGIGITTGMFLYEPGFYGVFDTDKAPLSKYLGFTYGPFLFGFGEGG